MKHPTCETCPYWVYSDDDEPHESVVKAFKDAGLPLPVLAPFGECRRYPPIPLTPDQVEDAGGEPWDTAWPEVKGNRWCGEHPEFPKYIASLDPVIPQELIGSVKSE